MFTRTSMRVLLTLVLAAAFTVGAGAAAHADNTVPAPDTWVEIYPPYFNTSASKCLDNSNGYRSINNPIQVFSCHGYASNGNPQRWQLFNRGLANDPVYEIRNVGSNLCLAAISSGAVVQQPCNEHFGGLWWLNPTQNVGPHFALQNVGFYGQCMATANSSGSDRTRVVIASCNYNNQYDINWVRQVWSFA
jgi:hypothetical protein